MCECDSLAGVFRAPAQNAVFFCPVSSPMDTRWLHFGMVTSLILQGVSVSAVKKLA